MNITLSARHSSISDSTKAYAMEKAEKLEKFYKLRKISIVMEIKDDQYSIEIVASPERGGNNVVGIAQASDWFAAVDQANDKVEKQLRKLKGKVKSRRMKKQKSETKEGVAEEKKEKEETYEDIVDQMEG